MTLTSTWPRGLHSSGKALTQHRHSDRDIDRYRYVEPANLYSSRVSYGQHTGVCLPPFLMLSSWAQVSVCVCGVCVNQCGGYGGSAVHHSASSAAARGRVRHLPAAPPARLCQCQDRRPTGLRYPLRAPPQHGGTRLTSKNHKMCTERFGPDRVKAEGGQVSDVLLWVVCLCRRCRSTRRRSPRSRPHPELRCCAEARGCRAPRYDTQHRSNTFRPFIV